MELDTSELPTHMAGMGTMSMMGVDMWMVIGPGMAMVLPSEFGMIRLSAMAPAGMWVEVDRPAGILVSGMLATGGVPDEWVQGSAMFVFTGLEGRSIAMADGWARTSLNAEAIEFDITDLMFDGTGHDGTGPWSFRGFDVFLDTGGVRITEPRTYTDIGLFFSLVEEQDSGAPFSRGAPEPATLALLALGAAALLRRGKR